MSSQNIRRIRNALLTFLFVVAVLSLPGVYAQFKRYQLDHSDHAQILAGCRELLVSRASSRNDREKWITAEKDDVVLLRPIPTDVPEAIRRLHPSVIFIHGDRVIISFTAPFARVSLLGFVPDARQFGTYKYIDGLWFWDGNDSTKQKNEN
jgi:hypothetical protein